MSKIIEDINIIIKEEKLDWFDVACNLTYGMTICEIDNNSDIEKSFKEYIIKNDSYHTTQEETKINLKKYVVEEVENWAEDLRNIVIEPARFLTDPGNCLQVNKKKINRIIDYLEDKVIKSYLLINPNIKKEDYLYEYLYTESDITGCIRCYETNDIRFIISFTGND